MKKIGTLLIVSFTFAIVFLSVVSAACSLSVSLVNQDPNPAVQGDTVKVLFQVSGVQDSSCEGASFQLDPGYSFSLSPQDVGVKFLEGGTFSQGFKNEWVIPYTLGVNKEALDGDSEVTVHYSPGSDLGSQLSKKFTLTIQDSRADFEVYVKDYNSLTKSITFEILNIAKVDTQALTVLIPDQENIEIKGSNVNIVGDLDSNEYTTADFEATAKSGDLNLVFLYTDQAEVRRTIEKTVAFNSKYFEDRAADQGGSPIVTWIILVVVIGLIVAWYLRRKKKKKLLAERRRHH
ncbi:MAG: hypothetical protein Q8Q04_00380 [archaeon]|nr:hypothetical protein [archaeon]